MKLEDLIKTVQKIDLMSGKLSNQKRSGGTLSIFKSRGSSFNSIRRYEIGDDIKNINWQATARFRETFVNTYNEDKVKTVWIIIDISGSSAMGTISKTKIDLELEIAITIAYSAIKQNDSVGVIFFSDTIQRLVMPINGMTGFWQIAKAMIESKPCAGNTDIKSSLDFLMKNSVSGNLIFIISDFLAEGYASSAAILAQHNDFFTIRVYDRIEKQFPKLGWVQMMDFESRKKQWMNTSKGDFDAQYRHKSKLDLEYYNEFLSKYAIRNMSISTDEDVQKKMATLMN
jgi:uncharacterized protein (DUF58 family)